MFTDFHCPLLISNTENYERITVLALDTLLWSIWHMAYLPISLGFFIVSFLQGTWNASQCFILFLLYFSDVQNGQAYLRGFFTIFYCTAVRKNLSSGIHSLRSIANYDFYAKFSKSGVHIFLCYLYEHMMCSMLLSTLVCGPRLQRPGVSILFQ